MKLATRLFRSAVVLGTVLPLSAGCSSSDEPSPAGQGGGAGSSTVDGTTPGVAGAGAAAVGGSAAGGSAASGGGSAAGGTSSAAGTASGGNGGATGGTGSSGGSSGGSAGGASAGSGGAAGSGGGGGHGGAGGAGGGSPVFHVFLLLGQSNMAGYPKAVAADKVEEPRIKVLGFDDCAATGRQTNKWDVAVAPLHECWNGALGPGDYFSKTLLKVLPAGDTIGLVPAAISGEKIETFLKVGGTKYTWIVDRAKLAQQAGGVIEGILFHQGESNNGDNTWPGKVKTLVTDLRTDLGLGNVPFLAGELAYDGGCAGHNTQVAKLPGLISNAFVVSASGLALDPADTTYHLHFGHDAQVEFGKRYEAKLVEALHW
jgi:hypothetical protein